MKRCSSPRTAGPLPNYVLGLTMKWVRENGGLAGMAARNGRKAAKLYARKQRYGDAL